MALTKADMAERLFDDLGLNKREAKEFVEAFYEELRIALETGGQIKLSGFGNLISGIKASALAVIQKLGKRFQSLPAE